MNTQAFDIWQILNSLYRRKDVIIAFFLVVAILSAYLAVSLPDIYRSSTLILVTPQSLPDRYIHSTVTSTIAQRMRGIAQQVLGRTMLENVVQEFDLYMTGVSQTNIEQRVAMLRNRIELAINRDNTFTLSFDADDPETARRVTARIAAYFIDANLKVREQQATGTTNFINAEAERLRRELEEQEHRVNKFRAQYWYELPDNREANSRALEQLRRELENGLIRITALQDRQASLENQIAEAEARERDLEKLRRMGSLQAGLGAAEIYDPKKELESLLSKYSERHPDVIRLRREVETWSTEKPTDDAKKTESDRSVSVKSPLIAALLGQLRDVKIEAASLQTKNKNLRSEISSLQSRLDNTSLRAIELSKITRDYDITLKKYQDLLAKALESELSENMEKKNKGEQFQIVDQASLPQAPVAPNRPRILLFGLVLGLGGGIGAAFLLENLTKSFKSNDDLAGYSEIPVLAVLPAVTTRGSILEQRHTRMMVVLLSCGSLAIGLTLLRFFGHMLPIR